MSAIRADAPSTTAATPTIAQSCARRLNLTYALLAAFGTRTAVRISSAESDVWRKSTNRSAAAIVRCPPGPSTVTVAVEREEDRRQVAVRVGVGDRPADRAAVSHLRVADPGRGLGQTGQPRRDDIRRGHLAWVVSAPIVIASGVSVMPRSDAIPPISISTSGAASRSFISGISE